MHTQHPIRQIRQLLPMPLVCLLLSGMLLLAGCAGSAVREKQNAEHLRPAQDQGSEDDESQSQPLGPEGGEGEPQDVPSGPDLGEFESVEREPAPPAHTHSHFHREESVLLRGGLGLTVDPVTALVAPTGYYYVTDNLGVGGAFQLGLGDDDLIAAPSANVRYSFDLEGDLEILEPFVEGGLGFAYIEKDRPGPDKDELGFLITGGGGFDVYLDERTSLGSSIHFNVLPTEVADEHFFFSWQVLAVGYRF